MKISVQTINKTVSKIISTACKVCEQSLNRTVAIDSLSESLKNLEEEFNKDPLSTRIEELKNECYYNYINLEYIVSHYDDNYKDIYKSRKLINQVLKEYTTMLDSGILGRIKDLNEKQRFMELINKIVTTHKISLTCEYNTSFSDVENIQSLLDEFKYRYIKEVL